MTPIGTPSFPRPVIIPGTEYSIPDQKASRIDASGFIIDNEGNRKPTGAISLLSKFILSVEVTFQVIPTTFFEQFTEAFEGSAPGNIFMRTCKISQSFPKSPTREIRLLGATSTLEDEARVVIKIPVYCAGTTTIDQYIQIQYTSPRPIKRCLAVKCTLDSITTSTEIFYQNVFPIGGLSLDRRPDLYITPCPASHVDFYRTLSSISSRIHRDFYEHEISYIKETVYPRLANTVNYLIILWSSMSREDRSSLLKISGKTSPYLDFDKPILTRGAHGSVKIFREGTVIVTFPRVRSEIMEGGMKKGTFKVLYLFGGRPAFVVKLTPKKNESGSYSNKLLDMIKNGIVLIQSIPPHPNVAQYRYIVKKTLEGGQTVYEAYMDVMFSLEHYLDQQFKIIITGSSPSNYLKAISCLLKVYAQGCAGIFHLHAHDMFHNDIKPDNFLVDSSGVVKVADFDTMCSKSQADSVDYTRSGTPNYFICHRTRGSHSDIYALGKLLKSLCIHYIYLFENCMILTEDQPHQEPIRSIFNSIKVFVEEMIRKKIEEGAPDYDNLSVTSDRILRKVKEWQENLAIIINSLDNPDRLFQFVRRDDTEGVGAGSA